jgi:hypothetical protein
MLRQPIIGSAGLIFAGSPPHNLLVQAFVAETAVATLDVSVLLGLAWVDVVPLNLVVVDPLRLRTH